MSLMSSMSFLVGRLDQSDETEKRAMSYTARADFRLSEGLEDEVGHEQCENRQADEDCSEHGVGRLPFPPGGKLESKLVGGVRRSVVTAVKREQAFLGRIPLQVEGLERLRIFGGAGRFFRGR